MVVAVAEVVRLLAPDIHGQLEPVAVARQAEVDVVGRREVEPAPFLEAERAVEADRGVDVADAEAGVDESCCHSHTLAASGAGFVARSCHTTSPCERVALSDVTSPRRAPERERSSFIRSAQTPPEPSSPVTGPRM